MGMKGHPQSNCCGGGEWIKKKKMVIALVILVGIMGVMVVQKVNDRRMFNLVIKEKDRQILSLHLLLQCNQSLEENGLEKVYQDIQEVAKERQIAKENKRKNQDLNAKLFSLRTQKVELNNKIMEMRSTIGSMKDEQQALELAIDEKHNEIKYKESELNDLRSSLRSPKIWSVSSDDPSNHEVNSTDKIITTRVKPWLGVAGNVQKPNQETVLEGVRGILNPEANVQKSKDLDQLASSKKHEAWDHILDHNDDAKVEMLNTTGTPGSKEIGDGLSIKGRKFFTGASESQRVKGEQHAIGSINQTAGQSDNKQLKTNREGPAEVTQSGKRNVDQETEREAERTDEDDEADLSMKYSMIPNKGSEEDQEYKDEAN
uniref:uncharacterized protein LOC122610893 n=1 Tax=Erigeron canadensis TaxID=72917 RepID=UPI001CB88E06|nr:uncharacterized protein LOC122610893 [Erigeron canadensis]